MPTELNRFVCKGGDASIHRLPDSIPPNYSFRIDESTSEMAKHKSSAENRLKNMHDNSALQDIIRLHYPSIQGNNGPTRFRNFQMHEKVADLGILGNLYFKAGRRLVIREISSQGSE